MGKLKERTARKYKPKRKFYGNRHTLGRKLSDLNEDTVCSSSQEEESSTVITTNQSARSQPVVVEEPGPSSASQSTLVSSITTTNVTTESSNPTLTSASANKISPLLEEDDEDGLSGFRLMDISLLNDIIGALPCPNCIVHDLRLIEQKSKNGFASEFSLICSATCGYEKDFSSSKKCGKGYEVNRRMVYSMRQVGVGYAGLSKFSTYMNMPSTMCKTSYNKINYLLKNADCSKENHD